MELFFSGILIIILLGMLYLLFKPKGTPKSKPIKQAEILDGYKDKMDKELLVYLGDDKLFLQKKMALLKSFATELNRNIFFDVDETKALIQKLVLYEIKKV